MVNLKPEVEMVQQIGELIGYGHMMALASALWRKNLKEIGTPETGAFVPTIIYFIKDEEQEMSKRESVFYDKLIEDALK